MKRLLFLLLLAPLLLVGGCTAIPHGSVAGGECKVFQAPKYAVRGATQYDQDWTDSTIEGGVGACGWKRPAARPASLDVVAGQPVVAKSPPKKRGLIRRIKDRLSSHPADPAPPEMPPSIEPVAPEPAPLPAPAPQTEEAAPPAPPEPPAAPTKKFRSRLEELLHPNVGLK